MKMMLTLMNLYILLTMIQVWWWRSDDARLFDADKGVVPGRWRILTAPLTAFLTHSIDQYARLRPFRLRSFGQRLKILFR